VLENGFKVVYGHTVRVFASQVDIQPGIYGNEMPFEAMSNYGLMYSSTSEADIYCEEAVVYYDQHPSYLYLKRMKGSIIIEATTATIHAM